MRKQNNYTIKNVASTLIMLFALAWLTVSLPYVYSYQQKHKEVVKQMNVSVPEEENEIPFANTTEEKTESNSNTLSEYLHDLHHNENFSLAIQKYYKCHPSDLYFAFHPELISPPPDA